MKHLFYNRATLHKTSHNLVSKHNFDKSSITMQLLLSARNALFTPSYILHMSACCRRLVCAPRQQHVEQGHDVQPASIKQRSGKGNYHLNTTKTNTRSGKGNYHLNTTKTNTCGAHEPGTRTFQPAALWITSRKTCSNH
jgi:hypothetical protein